MFNCHLLEPWPKAKDHFKPRIYRWYFTKNTTGCWDMQASSHLHQLALNRHPARALGSKTGQCSCKHGRYCSSAALCRSQGEYQRVVLGVVDLWWLVAEEYYNWWLSLFVLLFVLQHVTCLWCFWTSIMIRCDYMCDLLFELLWYAIYIYNNVSLYIYIYIINMYIYVYMYTQICVYLHTYTYIHTSVRTYVRTYARTHARTHTHTRTHARTHPHTHIHTYIHVY